MMPTPFLLVTELQAKYYKQMVQAPLSFTSQASSGVVTFTYTIGSTTTVITGNDDNSNTLLYTAGTEQVYLNGVKLIDGGVDYAATNSSTITLEANAFKWRCARSSSNYRSS